MERREDKAEGKVGKTSDVDSTSKMEGGKVRRTSSLTEATEGPEASTSSGKGAAKGEPSQQQQERQQQQQQQAQLCCFDRLKPRGKRKREEDGESVDGASSSSGSKELGCGGKKWRKEYQRLRTLVPALEERGENISKIEIIEETIRYIDALHHQLASRFDPEGQQSETDMTGRRERSKSPSENDPNCKIQNDPSGYARRPFLKHSVPFLP